MRMTTRPRGRHAGRLSKRRLAQKLRDYPLIRLLLFKRWFRLAFIGFVFLVLFLALFLPKMWVVTPRGFDPKIKISGLDLVQAWSLQRTAWRATTAGQYELADHAWQAAVANNPAIQPWCGGFWTMSAGVRGSSSICPW